MDRIKDIIERSGAMTFLLVSPEDTGTIISSYKACLKTGALFVINLQAIYAVDKARKNLKDIPPFNWKNVKIKFFKEDLTGLKDVIPPPLLYFYNTNKIDMFGIRKKKGKILMLVSDEAMFPRVLKEMGGAEGAAVIYAGGGEASESFRELCIRKGLTLKFL